MSNLTNPPRDAEVWRFNAFKGSELVYGSWAMRGAQDMEAMMYLKGLIDGRYDRVQVTHEKPRR
jgi:hypothetical protein